MNDKNGRQYRFLWLVAIVALVLSFLSYTKIQAGDVLSVSRLNFTGQEDQTVFRLSAPLPNPIVGGEEFERSSKVYGLQFLDEEGNELGGLGTIPEVRAGIFCFDHETAEAMCITKVRDSLQISLLNEPAPGAKVGEAGATRLAIGLEKSEGTAFIILADNEGAPRIKLSVGEDGEPRLEFWDANGELIESFPQKERK
jgi:hypothetical protein